MQSYTTQSHQRNYQGNVVLPTQIHTTQSQPKRHKALAGIATSALALAVAVTGGLFGSATLHNQTKTRTSAAAIAITEIDANQQNYNEERGYDQYYQTTVRERARQIDDEVQYDNDGHSARDYRDYNDRDDHHYHDAYRTGSRDHEDFTRHHAERYNDENGHNHARNTNIDRDKDSINVRDQNEMQPADNKRDENAPRDTRRPRQPKRLHRRPISEQEHETAPMPAPNYDRDNIRNRNANNNIN